MLTRTLTMLWTAALVGASAADAQQFPVPPQSLALDDTGTLEAMQGNLVKFRDSNKDVWVLKVDPRTQVSIEGEADLSYLRPGLTVELTGVIDESGKLAEPIEELKVLETKGRPSMGLFSTEEGPEGSKPVREPSSGTTYRVRGRIKTVNEGEIEIAAGRFTISGKAGDEFKARLSVDNPRLAKPGDTMQVKAWYYDNSKPNPAFQRPGQALAETLSITLSETPAGK